LNESGAFIDERIFVVREVLKISASFFDNRDGFASQRAFVDEKRPFQDFAIKGKFKVLVLRGIADENNISWDCFKRRYSDNFAISENIELSLIVSHRMNFGIEVMGLA
jgi:hypothetical protein